MATILDVAAKAGVGVGTVSRVLNNSPHVSEQTRTKVKAVIDELGYRPSPVARALSSGRTATIAVIAPHATRPSVVERLRGIVEVIAEEDYDLTLCSVQRPEQREAFMRRHAEQQRAAGVIVISSPISRSEVERFEDCDVPVVVIDHEGDGVPSVFIDDYAAGETATNFLLGLGHRRIALVGDADTSDYRSRASVQRQEGYRAAMHNAGVEIPAGYERTGNHSEHSAKVEAVELLGLSDRPTAVFATSDTSALGVLRAAREASVSVPDELSVLGFDDLWAAELMELSTIHQPLYESGAAGARLLLKLMAGEDVPGRTELSVRVVERTSTAPPARVDQLPKRS